MTDTKDEDKSDDLAAVIGVAELLWLTNSSDAVAVGEDELISLTDTNGEVE